MFVTREVNATSNVEPELCYSEIKAAIEAGAHTGKYDLRDKNCAKYKAEYDLKYGDPFRLKLKGEPNFSVEPKLYENDAIARDVCWDALAASNYDRRTYFTNSGCQTFLETVKTEYCFQQLNKIYHVDRMDIGNPEEILRGCFAYVDKYRQR